MKSTYFALVIVGLLSFGCISGAPNPTDENGQGMIYQEYGQTREARLYELNHALIDASATAGLGESGHIPGQVCDGDFSYSCSGSECGFPAGIYSLEWNFGPEWREEPQQFIGLMYEKDGRRIYVQEEASGDGNITFSGRMNCTFELMYELYGADNQSTRDVHNRIMEGFARACNAQ